MTMTKINTTKGHCPSGLFPMNEMKNGQVCYYEEGSCYVLRVSHVAHEPIFLILDDNPMMNSYGSECQGLVQELYEGESVTIKFS